MTTFVDAFLPVSTASSEPLDGRLTPTGAGVWTATAGATVNRNGNTGSAYLPAGAYAALTIGNGDIDVSVKGNRLAVRAQSATGKRYELRVTSSYVSGGYYTTETNYVGQYQVVSSYTLTADQRSCPALGSLTYRYQCGNPNFASYIFSQPCGSGSNYNASLANVAGSGGTCQVYRSYGYTVFSAQLYVVDSQGRESVVGSSVNTSGLDTGLLRLRAEGPTVTAWVDGQQVAQLTDDDVVSRSRNRVMIGQPSGAYSYREFVADTLNTAPNAPQTSRPATNTVIDRTITTRLAWLFNDPDAGDAQSRYDLRFRLLGATDWQNVTQETPDTFADFAAGTFDDGATYEWQVRTYDRAGLSGPYSAVDYFRAATPPPPPVWIIPTDDGKIPTQAFDVSWSSSAQVAYQVKIDSDAGNVYDTGRVASAERAATLRFPTNRVDRYLSVRVEAGELWSAWAVIRVHVSYTPPAVTMLELTPWDDEGSIHVQLRVPRPRGTQPRVLYQELFRVEGDGPEQLVAVNLIGDALWIDWTPASGINNRYRVIAYGENGTTSDSGLVDASTVVDVPVVVPDSYAENYVDRY